MADPLRMLDPRDLHALPAPGVPLALISLSGFDATGGRLAMTIRGPAGPGEIAALDVARGTIVAALRNRHVPVEYMLLANEGHGLTRRESLIAYFSRSYRFLSEHMTLAP